MNRKTSIKESIKSVLIVVLTLMTILLLYVFWADLELTRFSLSDIDLGFSDDDEERTVFVEDVAVPSYVIIGTGQGDYIVKSDVKPLYGSIEDPGSFVSSLLAFEQSDELFVEEISEEQYKEAYTYRSVRAVFDYLLPLGDYFKYKNVVGATGVEEIKNLSEIGFSAAATDSVLVKDASQNKYFRAVSGAKSEWAESFFSGTDFDSEAVYYPISALLGEGVDLDLLLPMSMESDMTERDIYAGRDTEADAMQAKSFFGNTFDFVRKIEESGGKVIYMYGYGETVLILNEDGSVEYKSEAAGTQSVNYFEALDIALQFFDSHQPIVTGGGIEPGVKLEKVKTDNAGHGKYRFELGLETDGEAIFFKEGNPVIIEVSGGVVTYYYAERPIIEPKQDAGTNEVFSALNTIAANYQNIAAALGEDLSMEAVAQRLTSVKYGYYADGDRLVPVWQIGVKGLAKPLYFDLYTSEQYGLD